MEFYQKTYTSRLMYIHTGFIHRQSKSNTPGNITADLHQLQACRYTSTKRKGNACPNGALVEM